MTGYLVHFGIQGQKWGVRRYQNEDGTWTEEGKIRYGKSWSEGSKEAREDSEFNKSFLGKQGVKTGSDYDVINKGTKMYRMTSSNEKIDGKRKYVSIDSDDADKYHEYARCGVLWNNDPSSTVEKTYVAQRDLKVAKGEEVVSHIVNSYGNLSIKTAYEKYSTLYIDDTSTYQVINNFIKEFGDRPVSSALNMIKNDKGNIETHIMSTSENPSNKVYTEIRNAKFGGMTIVHPLVANHMEEHADEVISTFKKKGYDAIVDAEDWVIGNATYPVILLGPTTNDIKDI